MGFTGRLAEFVSNLKYEDLPTQVILEAKLCILDWFGVALSGSKEPFIDILLQVIREEGCTPRASIVGRSFKLSLQQAALINGSSSHALDFDDVHASMMGHPSAVILPSSLALGEFKKCSGRDLITAFVAGFETVCHVGLSQTRSHIAQGWHPTATIGHFGSVTACANLLHLDIEKSVNAIGIAGTQASGLRQVFGTMSKPLHAGKASMNGLFAAQLAERGFTSSSEILEGKHGFTQTFTPDGNLEYSCCELGKNYEILKVMFKRYASCFGTHPTIDAALSLRNGGLKPDDIESVHVVPFHGLFDSINNMKPENSMEGKFSVPYTFAVAFMKGRAGEDEFTEKNIRDPDLVRIRDKVTMGKDEYMPYNNSLIIVKTRDGRVIEKHIDVNEVFKDSEKKNESLKNKFLNCAHKVISIDQSENLMAGIMTLEKIEDISELIALSRK